MIFTTGARYLETQGHVGCLPDEKQKKTRLIFNITLTLDLDCDGSLVKDTLENTFDYRVIKTVVDETLASRHFAVIESLAAIIAEKLLNSDDRILKVRVNIEKPDAVSGAFRPWTELELSNE
ncbi:dihydroneopterin aldolase [Myxococcota bacterium]|nr:dihydroneopterin aldolase [Myxococcota bacterium]MBU1381225.1 dihydroneopterin aldolase [Myxococcota bacterium]MBU1496925.1 dihydroneopterin aldolase [Myxococcota bacterium]